MIYEYILNNIQNVWIYGLQKGALGTAIDKAGTDFDQAALMVALLREAGFTASYQPGKVSLSGSAFTAWSGVSDAKAACQLLSSGGIPGVINGTTNPTCDFSPGTAISNVTMSTVWVIATIPGSSCDDACFFDPSLKSYTWKTGIDLASATGLMHGDPLSQAKSGMDSGTVSGVSYVQNLNAPALSTTLQGYATNLLNCLKTRCQSLPAAPELEDVIGGSVVVPFVSPSGGTRQTLPSNYTVQHTWTGNIPNQYRTTLEVQGYMLKGMVDTSLWDVTFYVDDIYGRMLTADGNYTGPGSQYQLHLRVDGNVIAYYNFGTSTGTEGGNPAHLLLTVNHPYVAAADGSHTPSGDYMDTAVDKKVSFINPMTIVHAWGFTNPVLLAKWTSERTSDGVIPNGPDYPCTHGGGEMCVQNWYMGNQGDFRREKIAAGWMVDTSRAAMIDANIAASIAQLHHEVGVVFGDAIYSVGYPDGYASNPSFSLADNFDRIDVDTGISITSKTADVGTRRAAIQTIAAASAALEGEVPGENADLPDMSSTATRFGWGNAPPSSEDPSGAGPRKFLQYDSTNYSEAASLALVEGASSTTSDGISNWGDQPEIGDIEFGEWKNSIANVISAYAQDGFTIVTSQEAFLGPGQRAGAISGTLSSPPSTYTHFPSLQRGGAIAATRYVDNDPVEIAHLVTGQSAVTSTYGPYYSKGGGGGTGIFQAQAYNPSEAADALKSKFVDRSHALGVDLSNGTASYTTPASLTVGNGGFPYALTASLSWNSAPPPPDSFAPVVPTRPQSGVTSNWHNTLDLSESAMESMGQSDIRAAVGVIVSFLAAQDIYVAVQSPERDVAGLLTIDWWQNKMVHNVATSSMGTSSQHFVKLADDSWIMPGSGYASLVQNGTPVPYEDKCGGIYHPAYALTRGWDLSDVSFDLTNAHGDTEHFAYWENLFYTTNNTGQACAKLKGFRLTQWSFPQGVDINLTYGDPYDINSSGLTPHIEQLTKVSNSVGQEIDFESSVGTLLGFNNGKVSSDLRSVNISRDSTSITVDDPNGKPTTMVLATLPTGARPNANVLLGAVFTADNLTQANTEYDYDLLGRVLSIADAVAIQDGTRGPYQFFLADGTRGERDDPLGQPYTVVYDTYGHPMRYIDELGFETDASFDSRSRPVHYIYPEGDCDAFAYDDHNNTRDYWRVDSASSCNTGAGSTHILHTSAVWDQTWNKPTSITNPRGFETDFAYYNSGNGTSLLRTATRPTIDEGTPVYSFTYDAAGKVLTSLVPFGPSQNITTTNTYDATTEYLLTSTLDPGTGTHVNATTSYGYDDQGDVYSITDPNGNLSYSFYDNGRRPTETDHLGPGATLNAAFKTIYDAVGRDIEDDAGWTFSGATVTSWKMTKTTAYTPTSKVATVTDGDNRTTTYAYDDGDRTQIVTDPVSRKTRFYYCAPGDSNCAANQVAKEVRAWQGSSSACAVAGTIQQCYRRVTYFPDGEQNTIEDANNNITTYGYDLFQRLNQTTYPDSSYEHLTLDANGNVTARRNRAGQTLTYTYNALDWTTEKYSPSPVVTTDWTYQLNGSVDTLADTASNSLNIGYDTAGRLESTATVIPGLSSMTASYVLDDNGNRTKLTWPDGYYVNYTYDNLNRMKTAADSLGTSLATYGYDQLSRRTSLAYGNGASVAYTYTIAGDLLTLNHDLTGSSDDPQFTYTYTNAHQLNTESVSDSDYLWQPTANSSTAYTANNLNQYSAVAGTPFAYDLKGNLTNDGRFPYTYDAENRLLTAGPVTTYAYDPLGRRTTKVFPDSPVWGTVNWGSFNWTAASTGTTYYISDGTDEIVEYNSSGALITRYVPGPAIDEPIAEVPASGTTEYFHTNRQGSVIAMSGPSAGKVEGPFTYSPYGVCYQGATATPCDASGEPYRFTGRRFDPETGLYYYRARYYAPDDNHGGRFLQTDPVGYSADLNLYTYGGNDPTDKVDPLGNCPPSICHGVDSLGDIEGGNANDFHDFTTQIGAVGLPMDAVTNWSSEPGAPAIQKSGNEGIRVAANGLGDTTIFRTPGDLAEDAIQRTKWASVGVWGEQQAEEALIGKGYTIVGTHVYVRTSAGLRVTDFLITGGVLGKNIAGYEVKVNNSPYLLSQRTKDALIQTQGGTVVSRGSLLYGQNIRYTTYLMYVKSPEIE